MARSPFHPKALVEDRRSVGAGTRVWAFAHVMRGARVGRDCNLCDGCFIETGSVVGDRVTVKNGVSIWEKVHVGDDVFIGPNAVFTNDLRPVSRRRDDLRPTFVGQGACIGANATILCGLTVGRYAFVGAGSVVTRPVPDHALVYGNPARRRGWLCRCRKSLVFRAGSARCACGLRYRLAAGRVREAAR
ncbi:MAG: dTDP-3-amino-3,6-dideoxy-alpha-D-galactopyranose 3-N-acetyltransferase [Candidatus Omnitrophica bacterium]|nr:dTDP-3-amino-3,6-dideoxy-alpha-D-galactopyranose 3-N-acetyltransferase [Candidatus Omnitrophota bacterium]